ncbi:MAG: hypothetical protein ACF8R9_01285 [Phycisphaerales bacterium JB054]
MNWGLMVRVLGVCALQFAPLASGQGGPAGPASRVVEGKSEFLAWCEANAPEDGSVVVTYARGDGVSQVSVGLDAASRAWFYATERACAGRTASGRVFRGPPGEVRSGAEAGIRGTPIGVAEYIPAGYLFHFMEAPDTIRELHAESDGGWTVAYQAVAAADRPLAEIRFDQAGRVVRSWLRDETDRRERAVTYESDRKGSVFALATGVGARGDRDVLDVQSDTSGAGVQAFEVARVEAAARGISIDIQTTRAAKQLGYERDAYGGWVLRGDPLSADYQGQGIARWRWPVLGAGALLVVIGGFELWRRRSSASG